MLEYVLLRPFDVIRARILRHSLRVSFFKRTFVHRHVRSNCIVGGSIILNVILMVYCPLWTLLIAPSILGKAHLIESLSSFHDIASPRELKELAAVKKRTHQALAIFCLVFLSVRLIFLVSDFFSLYSIAYFLQKNLRLLDMSVVMLAFLYFCHHYNIGIQKRFCGALCLSLLGYVLVGGGALWGCFIFAHNFICLLVLFCAITDRKIFLCNFFDHLHPHSRSGFSWMDG